MAAQVGSDDEVLLGERLDLAVPEPPVADARVQEDDGGPLSRRVVGDLGAVDPGPAQLSVACWASRRRRASDWRNVQATC